jgi:hypothetical protein
VGLLDFKSSGGQLTWPRWVRFPCTPANTLASAPGLVLGLARTCRLIPIMYGHKASELAHIELERQGIVAFPPNPPKAKLAIALFKSQLILDDSLGEACRRIDFLGQLN